MPDKSLDITDVVKKQELLDQYPLSNLEKLVKEYPFSSTFQVLYLKKLQLEGKEYLDKLPEAAAHVNDRKRLFEIIFNSHGNAPAVTSINTKNKNTAIKPTKPGSGKKKAKKKPVVIKKAQVIKNPKKIAKSSKAKKPVKKTVISKAIKQKQKISTKATKPKPAISSKTKKKKQAPKVIPKPKISQKPKKAVKQVKKNKSVQTTKKTAPVKPKSDIIPAKKKRLTNPARHVIGHSAVNHSAKANNKAPFLDWLDTFNQNKKYSVKDLEANYAASAYNIDPLVNADSEEINQFLKQEINKKKQKNTKNKKVALNKRAKTSIQNNKKNATETLANIYVKQKKYDKALEIYKSLNLKYPEKNTYFASKMKQIRSLQK